MSSKETVRVRFAPSPTGFLHIGGARTALFNWIYAKSKHGAFVLRIEDTDKERSRKEFEKDIVSGLTWLGLEWSEFYRQSERSSMHREHLEKLLNEGWIYYCFCTEKELEEERQAMLSQGLPPKYSGKCRGLEGAETKKRLDRGEGHVLRFKVREAKLEFKDMIRGTITFDTGLIGDFIVARDLDKPLYNFAVVVDDALSNITHVIRGDEHISNTPRQILIMNALGFDVPKFAHLPIILNPDRSKMSKRYADTALREYIKAGYLKEAMVNFLAYLGWHPKEDKEMMSIQEIINEFDLSRVQKGGAVFNAEKLEWLNGQYLQMLHPKEFVDAAEPFLPEGWKLTPEMAASAQTRVKKLSEVKELVDFYFELPAYETGLLRWRDQSLKDTAQNLKGALHMIEKIPNNKFRTDVLEKHLLENIAKERRGDVLWPLRVALSGKKESPSPFEIMEALGKEETLKRIHAAMGKIGMLEL